MVDMRGVMVIQLVLFWWLCCILSVGREEQTETMKPAERRWGCLIAVVSGVAASTIFEASRNWLIGMAKTLWHVIATGWSWLFSSHQLSLPGVVIVLFVIVAAVVLIGFIFALWVLVGSKDADWKSFRRLSYHGMIWNWEFDALNQIYPLRALCPGKNGERCERVLYADVAFGPFSSGERAHYHCGRCGWETILDFRHPDLVEHDVKLEIDRLLRTDEWKKQSGGNT
jgi:hypothetical protein